MKRSFNSVLMKTKLYALLIFLLTSQLTFSGNGWNGKHTKEKTIKKDYTVDSDALLKIKNSYGNIDIITHSGNTVSIEVNIKTNGNDLDKVEKKLDDISVDFQGSSSMISAKTIFRKSKSVSWWNWGRNTNVSMEINYVVKLPISSRVDLSNDYGSINLDRLEGQAKINCDYGKVTTKELMADDNLISFDYTNNSYFEYIKSGKINANYSSFTVGKTKNLEVTADYTKSVVEIAENVRYTCDYGSVFVEKANNVIGKGDYLTARFGEIYKNIQIRADYGSIKIDRMTVNAGHIDINSDYTGITIGYDAAYLFKFDITLEYASLRGMGGLQFSRKREESASKFYQGYHGDANAKNFIKITSDYGNITFKKNN